MHLCHIEWILNSSLNKNKDLLEFSSCIYRTSSESDKKRETGHVTHGMTHGHKTCWRMSRSGRSCICPCPDWGPAPEMQCSKPPWWKYLDSVSKILTSSGNLWSSALRWALKGEDYIEKIKKKKKKKKKKKTIRVAKSY